MKRKRQGLIQGLIMGCLSIIIATLVIGCYVPESLDPMSRLYKRQEARIDDQIAELHGTSRTRMRYQTTQPATPTETTTTYIPQIGDTIAEVSANWGKYWHRFVDSSGEIRALAYKIKVQSTEQMVVIATEKGVVTNTASMTPDEFKVLRAELTANKDLDVAVALSKLPM